MTVELGPGLQYIIGKTVRHLAGYGRRQARGAVSRGRCTRSAVSRSGQASPKSIAAPGSFRAISSLEMWRGNRSRRQRFDQHGKHAAANGQSGTSARCTARYRDGDPRAVSRVYLRGIPPLPSGKSAPSADRSVCYAHGVSARSGLRACSPTSAPGLNRSPSRGCCSAWALRRS
jgi:hypothetical protein